MKTTRFIIELKDIKTRQHFAPATKKINSKKIFKRNKRVDIHD
jgi:hypothetical protein